MSCICASQMFVVIFASEMPIWLHFTSSRSIAYTTVECVSFCNRLRMKGINRAKWFSMSVYSYVKCKLHIFGTLGEYIGPHWKWNTFSVHHSTASIICTQLLVRSLAQSDTRLYTQIAIWSVLFLLHAAYIWEVCICIHVCKTSTMWISKDLVQKCTQSINLIHFSPCALVLRLLFERKRLFWARSFLFYATLILCLLSFSFLSLFVNGVSDEEKMTYSSWMRCMAFVIHSRRSILNRVRTEWEREKKTVGCSFRECLFDFSLWINRKELKVSSSYKIREKKKKNRNAFVHSFIPFWRCFHLCWLRSEKKAKTTYRLQSFKCK